MKPDRARMAKAIRDFLAASGVPRNGDLTGTPARVALAWEEDFLDGYSADPAKILRDTIPARSREELVVAKGIDFHSMCPHHLLPYRGVGHLAYLPAGKIVGFGALVKLLDCFAHRLILQEEITQAVAQALVTHLGARGAACLLDAEQGCMTMRGSKRRSARTVTRAFEGALARKPALRNEFLEAIAS